MIADVITGLFVVAIIYVLVRPRSAGVDFVKSFGAALTAIIKNATDIAA